MMRRERRLTSEDVAAHAPGEQHFPLAIEKTERTGNHLKMFRDFHLKAKAILWP